MPSEQDLLEQVVSHVVGSAAEVEWLAPGPSWSGHVQLRGATGLVGCLLTSPEWQEARFQEPRCSIFITTSSDEEDVHDTLAKLARAIVVYLAGGGRVEYKK